MKSRYCGMIVGLLVVCCCLLATPADGAWINEIHYDNDGTDVGEFVEIVLAPGELIVDFSLEFYNGSSGATYSGPSDLNIGSVVNGYSLFWFDGAAIQNGDPDGVALVDSGSLVQFLSYDGSFMGVGGAADGVTSTDIGVSEPSSTPIGQSLQLTGTGMAYADFSWSGPTDDTPGAVNVGQTLVPEPTSAALVAVGALLAVATRRRRQAI